MQSDLVLRQQVLDLLGGGNAHLGLEEAVIGFPLEQINTHPPNVSYTPWHLLEHIRIAQWDILEFMRSPGYVSPAWPEGYWPGEEETTDEVGWRETIQAIQADLESVKELVRDPAQDLTAELAHAPGYAILREALLVADHNAYHLGEFAVLRQVMDNWVVSE
jgi:hypothetical protein